MIGSAPWLSQLSLNIVVTPNGLTNSKLPSTGLMIPCGDINDTRFVNPAAAVIVRLDRPPVRADHLDARPNHWYAASLNLGENRNPIPASL